MGGIEVVLVRARADYVAGDYLWVVHILDQLIWAKPNNMAARELAAAAHTQMGYGSENSIWRNAYLSMANELREGLPKGDKNHWVLRDVLKGMSPLLLMNSISIQVNGPKVAGRAFTINWCIVGTDESCHSRLSNAVLNTREGLDLKAALSVNLPPDRLSAFALGHSTSGGFHGLDVVFEGDQTALSSLEELLDIFPAWFSIAIHDLKSGETIL